MVTLANRSSSGDVIVARWADLNQWDYLTADVALRQRLTYPVLALGEIIDVRRERVPLEDLASGAVAMVDRVSFSGEVFAGKRQTTRMTQYLAKPGDVVVSKIRARQGSVGLVEREMGPVGVTTHYRVLVPDPQHVLPRFAWLALRSSFCRDQFLAATGGAMKGEISERALLQIRVPVPSLSEQHAIVSEWEDARTQYRAAQLRAFDHREALGDWLAESLGVAPRPLGGAGHAELRAVWSDMERWSVSYNRAAATSNALSSDRFTDVALGDIATMFQYGTSTKANTYGRGTAVLRMNNIVDGQIDFADLKHVELDTRERDRFLLSPGDILINRTNSKELVGKSAMFETSGGDYVFASYLIRVRVDEELALPLFVAQVLNAPIVRRQIDAVSRQIIGQANINVDELKQLRFPLPPINVQRSIMKGVRTRQRALSALYAEVEEARRRAEELIDRVISRSAA